MQTIDDANEDLCCLLNFINRYYSTHPKYKAAPPSDARRIWGFPWACRLLEPPDVFSGSMRSLVFGFAQCMDCCCEWMKKIISFKYVFKDSSTKQTHNMFFHSDPILVAYLQSGVSPLVIKLTLLDITQNLFGLLHLLEFLLGIFVTAVFVGVIFHS